MGFMAISVVVCTYEPDKSLLDQIESINKAMVDGVDVKISIFDDSTSNNRVLEILKNKYSSGLEIFDGPKQGSPCSNFIYSLSQLDTDWVFFSDQDDIWEVTKVEEYLKIVKEVDDRVPQIVFSDASLINERGDKICESFFKYQGLSEEVLSSDDILFKNCVQGATLCLNRAMINLINETLDGEDISCLAMHDWWIAILARYCGNWTFINKPLLRYRQHDRNVVGAKEKSNILVKFFKNPFIYYRKLNTLKCQYQLWMRVSKRVKGRSSFNRKKMNISLLSKCKLLVISLIP